MENLYKKIPILIAVLFFILITAWFFMGNLFVNPHTSTGRLPVVDFSKDYPQKKMHLQDIANLEYIPLETTKDVLFSEHARLSYVSDNYILVYEPLRGDIFIFHTTGKLFSHFNHKGGSGQEYAWIGGAGVIFDEKNEEIFVCHNSIQVYSLNGKFKRTLRVNTIRHESKVSNFDDEAFLIYDDMLTEPDRNEGAEKPYRLLSKTDGSLISVLNISLPKRYSSRIAQVEGKNWRPLLIYYLRNPHYGQDIMIADISSDTLYQLTQDKKLTPLLTRKPSVHASEPRLVWTTFLTTDRFILIGAFLLDFNSKGGRIPTFMYEFDTGEISKPLILDYDLRDWRIDSSPSTMDKNMTAELIQASSIIQAYKRQQL